jgi:MFS family permease
MTTASVSTTARGITPEERKVIFASSLGTVFEWYDFYLYGSLAAIIAKQFFAGDPNTAFIFALLAFAAGFIVRPFGALVFGRLGDMIGRKYTFLVTILIMGASTFIVGLLPNYAHRHRRADHPDHPAHAAGPGAGRRVRRRGHLRGRARAARRAAPSPRGSRPPPRWACSCRCW